MTDLKDAKKWIEEKEKALAKSVIKWKLSRDGIEVPGEDALDSQSERVVKEANRIMKDRGKEVLSDIKSGIGKFMDKGRK